MLDSNSVALIAWLFPAWSTMCLINRVVNPRDGLPNPVSVLWSVQSRNVLCQRSKTGVSGLIVVSA